MTTNDDKPKRTRPDLVTGRTVPWGTKLSPEWIERIRAICFRDRIKANELIERGLTLYDANAAGDMAAAFRVLWTQATPEQRDAIRKLVTEGEAQ